MRTARAVLAGIRRDHGIDRASNNKFGEGKRSVWRKRTLFLVGGIAAAASVAAWWFIAPPDPLAVPADQVRRVEVQFEPWGEDGARPPGASSEDRDAIAALVAVVRSAQETPDHKCGSRGSVRFLRFVGLPAELWFLPGHHPEWYEFRAGRKAYRVPRAEFVTAMRRVGVEVPLVCR